MASRSYLYTREDEVSSIVPIVAIFCRFGLYH